MPFLSLLCGNLGETLSCTEKRTLDIDAADFDIGEPNPACLVGELGTDVTSLAIGEVAGELLRSLSVKGPGERLAVEVAMVERKKIGHGGTCGASFDPILAL